jgi:hypothetical protein
MKKHCTVGTNEELRSYLRMEVDPHVSSFSTNTDPRAGLDVVKTKTPLAPDGNRIPASPTSIPQLPLLLLSYVRSVCNLFLAAESDVYVYCVERR